MNDNQIKKIRNKRDKEIANILENTVMQHIEKDNNQLHIRMLKNFIEVLKL